MKIYGKAIYNGRPYMMKQDDKNFILRDVSDESRFYLFKHDVTSGGNENVSIDGNKSPNTVVFDGFDKEIDSIKWMDNGKDLDFSLENGILTVHCINFSYGTSYCVRVAEIKVK